MTLAAISAVIITRDAEATLATCLDSLREFPEVLIYDNGSSDLTAEIAARYPNVSFHQGEFLGFGPTKQRAVELAAHDWVLSIDADEHLDPALVENLRSLDASQSQLAFELLRHNRFMGRTVRYGGWGGDWLLRVFHRDNCRFDTAQVHEKVLTSPGVTTRRLDGPLWHEAVTDLDQFLTKIGRYSELRRHEPGRRDSPAILIALRSFWAFFRSYLLQGGILAGWRGLVIATCAGGGTFFKYMKVHADRAVAREQLAATPDKDARPPPN